MMKIVLLLGTLAIGNATSGQNPTESAMVNVTSEAKTAVDWQAKTLERINQILDADVTSYESLKTEMESLLKEEIALLERDTKLEKEITCRVSRLGGSTDAQYRKEIADFGKQQVPIFKELGIVRLAQKISKLKIKNIELDGTNNALEASRYMDQFSLKIQKSQFEKKCKSLINREQDCVEYRKEAQRMRSNVAELARRENTSIINLKRKVERLLKDKIALQKSSGRSAKCGSLKPQLEEQNVTVAKLKKALHAVKKQRDTYQRKLQVLENREHQQDGAKENTFRGEDFETRRVDLNRNSPKERTNEVKKRQPLFRRQQSWHRQKRKNRN